ncbi:hypothetical protein CC86DRAFT_284709 [Ophiobolus disseminans]|uniref:RCC1/BLIP-II n=1 Tax=Ophiobolus disseminans TaxID=1469910 RepID=A0A6A7A8S4_9PLEO|nr:hypothetical protein CC86DRAFT_284709 [Ophiobolus disseminans]
MELLVFGHNAHFSSHVRLRHANPAHNPTYNASTRALCATEIQILWSSWCDAVIAYRNNTNDWSVEYVGTGLTDSQRDRIDGSEVIAQAVDKRTLREIDFFGSAMHDGLRGYVVIDHERKESKATSYATELEMEAGVPEQQFHSVPHIMDVLGIRVGSNNDIHVSTVSTRTGGGYIHHLAGLADLWETFASNVMFPSAQSVGYLTPVQWCTNATTATALDKKGRVYTATRDPRYPNCLGRAYAHAHPTEFLPMPYLSETYVTEIASGGYMTAAASASNELFLWGQACPGSDGELSVLREHVASNDSQTSGIRAEDEQDDIVKCLTVRIDGEEAYVVDVAVGHGHVLVAAEVQRKSDSEKRAVFAAGDNSKGQLGFDPSRPYLPDFEEVVAFRGKKIQQLAASGWSSYIVSD